MHTSSTRSSPRPRLGTWVEPLRDHHQVLIRPISRADREAEREFIESLSPESRRFRFLGQVSCPSEALIDDLTGVDQVSDVAYAAIAPDEDHTRIVGVARYCMDSRTGEAECAVTVADGWQGRGLAVVLMGHLIEAARSAGVRRLVSIDAAENDRMKQLAAYLGFSRRPDPEDATQVLHELQLQPGTTGRSDKSMLT